MKLEMPPNAPQSENSEPFHQGMVDRMGMSYAKYGAVSAAYPRLVDAIASLELRLQRYKSTGNTELLMDVANFAMIEFMHPRHPQAHFNPSDSHASPGRQWVGETDPSQRSQRFEWEGE